MSAPETWLERRRQEAELREHERAVEEAQEYEEYIQYEEALRYEDKLHQRDMEDLDERQRQEDEALQSETEAEVIHDSRLVRMKDPMFDALFVPEDDDDETPF